MSVMVTGPGFVGSYVARDLLVAGESVVLYGFLGGDGDRAVSRLPDLAFIKELVGDELFDSMDVVVGDITDLARIEDVLDAHGVTSMVHLASKVTSAAEANPASAIRVNAEGTATLFEAAARATLQKVVFASSSAVFGPASIGRRGFVTDDGPYDPQNIYGATKVLCEQLARNYHERRGLNVTGLRLSRVYGYGEHIRFDRGGGSSWLTRLLHDAAVSTRPVVIPFGEEMFDFHYVEDVSAALVQAVEIPHGSGEAYLIHGDYRPLRAAVDFVRSLLPEADLTLVRGPGDLEPGYSTSWRLPLDSSRAEAELAIRSQFDMETGVLRTINRNRAAAGQSELAYPSALVEA